MKTKKLLVCLLVPALAFIISSCKKDSSSSSNSAATTPSVSINDVVFSDEASSQIVTIVLGKYTNFGAEVDADGSSWCSVEILDDRAEGRVKIDVRPNSTNTKRTCNVNVWVGNTDDPDDENNVVMPILVEQEAYRIVVTEATWMKFNFEMEADRTCTWSYDGGGSFTVSQMKYIWFRDFQDMHVTQSNDTVTFWGTAQTEGPNGDIYYYNDRYVWFMITGFAEPFDNCKVSLVNYDLNSMGHNPDPNGNWQTDTTYAHVRIQNIPLVDYNININNKTGSLHFDYEAADLDVIEGHYNSYSRTKDGYFQEEDFVWVGRDRDEGEVEVHFNIR